MIGMRKILIASVLITALVACSRGPEANSLKLPASPSPAQALVAKPIKVGLVDNSDNQYNDGCGCGFYPVDKPPKFNDPANQKYLLIGNYEKQAWISIDDQIIQLRLVNDTVKYQGNKGDRYQQSYRSGDLTVDVECVATGFGDTHGVDCDATITVVKGDRKQVVKAIGSCGC
jgi:hypothetical protein